METYTEFYTRMRPVWLGKRVRTPEEVAEHKAAIIAIQNAKRVDYTKFKDDDNVEIINGQTREKF